MPNYDYQCSGCGEIFEVFQSITAKPLEDCAKCSGKKTLKRLIGSGSGVIFKGTGFYQTDYRSSSYQKDAAKEKPSSSPACASCPSSNHCKAK